MGSCLCILAIKVTAYKSEESNTKRFLKLEVSFRSHLLISYRVTPVSKRKISLGNHGLATY